VVSAVNAGIIWRAFFVLDQMVEAVMMPVSLLSVVKNANILWGLCLPFVGGRQGAVG